MKASRGILALLAVLQMGGVAAGSEPTSMAPRRQLVLDAAWTKVQGPRGLEPGWGDCFPLASALFATGHVAEARVLAHRGLEALSPENKLNRWIHGGNSGFAAWPGLDCYLRFTPLLDEPLREHYRQVYTTAAFYKRLSTSNHKIMAAVTRTLATQIWGPDAFIADPRLKDPAGSIFAKDDPTGENYVRRIIADTLAGRIGEYASRPYGAQNILPLLSIADLSVDPGLRAAARAAFEHALWQLAPVWLRGHLPTYSARSYPDMESQQPWGLAAVLWLYFGGVPPQDLAHSYLLLAAVSKFEPATAMLTAAGDRSQPFVVRSRTDRVALSHFLNRTYALFSFSAKGGQPVGGQVYPSGVMWEDPNPDRASQLWLTNPAADTSDDPKLRSTGIHTHGVSGRGREVQFRDALLAVYDLRAKARFPYVLGFVPGGARALINESAISGRIFLHYDSVMIAISASSPFPWNPAVPMRTPAGPPHPGDSEFRIPGPLVATAIETALPAEFPGNSPSGQLEAFREAILKRSRLSLSSKPELVGSYVDRRGNALSCTYDGEDTINGTPVDYAKWPMLECPWSPIPSKVFSNPDPSMIRPLLLIALAAPSLHAVPMKQIMDSPPPTEYTYKTVDGAPLKLAVFPAVGSQPGQARAAVVWIHGGAWRAGAAAAFFPQARYFASRGAVGVSLDYRLLKPGGPTVADCLSDCKSAIRYLRSHAKELGIDPDRIAIAGDSAGGHLAAALGTLEGFDDPQDDPAISSRPNVMLLYNPIVDMTEAPWIRFAVGGDALVNEKTTPLPSDAGSLAKARSLSPLFSVKPEQPPTLLVHGLADHVVSPEQARRFTAAMMAAGNRCELVLLPDTGHAFIVTKYKSSEADIVKYLRATDVYLASLGYTSGPPTLETSSPPAWVIPPPKVPKK